MVHARPLLAVRAVAVLAVLALALLALTVVAAPASAHAVLLGSTPADGAVLDAAPAALELRFNEPVGAREGSVRILAGDGSTVEIGSIGTTADGTTVAVGLPGDLADGSYVVSYRVISADDHPVRGALVFSIGAEGAVAAPTAESSGPPAAETWAMRANRLVLLVASLLAAGGLLFLGAVHDGRADERRRLGRIVVLAAAAAAATTVSGVLLQSWLLGGSAGGAVTELPATLTSSYGAAAGLRLVGLAAIVAAVVLGSRGRSRALSIPVVLLVAVVPAASFALTGHTLTSEPRWLATAANVGHTAAGAAWFGGLVLLALTLRGRRRDGDAEGAGRIIARFSRLALGTVALLAIAGGLLAWVEVRRVDALLTTDYGRALTVKLGLLAVVAGVAGYNHLRLVPSLRGEGSRASALRRLSRTVRLEVVGIVLAVAVTAVLVDLTPAREAYAASTSEIVALGDLQLELTVDNPRPGAAELHLYLLDELGRPVDSARGLALRFSSPDAGIAPIDREPSTAGPGHWVHRADAMSVPGAWEVEAVVRISDFEQRRTTFHVELVP